MAASILQVFKSSTSTSGGSIAQTCTGLTSGSALVCWVQASGVDTYSFADNINGSWGTALDTILPSSGFLMAQAYLASTASGTVTVTVTFDFAPGAAAAIWVAEIGSPGVLDGHNGVNQATPGSGTDAIQTSVTNAGQPGLLIGWGNNSNSNNAVGTGFTLQQSDADGTLEYKSIATTGSQLVSLTNSLAPTDTVIFGLFFLDAIVGPTINTQPVQTIIYAGQTATFTVAATTSGGSLSYQWTQNGSNVGTNSSSYTTTTATNSNNLDVYQVGVTDSNGTVLSTAVYLIVIPTGMLAWYAI